MPRNVDDSLIVGLDIGTSKIAVIVGRLNFEGEIEIVGIGSYPSRGLKKGVVVNIETTVESMTRALEEAKLMAGCDIQRVYTGIAGSHINSFNSRGMVAISGSEVTSTDISRVIDAAKALPISADQKILHILPQEFIIDQQLGIKEPIGMSGLRLEANVHMVTGSVSAAQNIIKCIRLCGLEVEDIILEQLASSYAVLTEDEKNLGVCLVDIGGGTSDIAIFTEGAIRHTAVIPIAGDQVTNDLAVALRTPTTSAECVKIKYGFASPSLLQEMKMIEVPRVGDRGTREIPSIELLKVISPRYEELFKLVKEQLKISGLEQMVGSGIVLTGGSAKMAGVLDLAESVLEMPVRLGLPRNVSGLIEAVSQPMYATGVGLLHYGLKSRQQNIAYESNIGAMSFSNIFSRMQRWFQGR